MIVLWNFESLGCMLFEKKSLPRLVRAGEQWQMWHQWCWPTIFMDIDSSLWCRCQLGSKHSSILN